MKLAGFLLMLSGWVICLTALALLPSQSTRVSFLGGRNGGVFEAIGTGDRRTSPHPRQRGPRVTGLAFSGLLILLIPRSQRSPGLALMRHRVDPARGARRTLLVSTLTVAAVAVLSLRLVCGFVWQGLSRGGLLFALTVAGKQWNWIGAERGCSCEGWTLRGLPRDSQPVFGMFGAALVAIIPLGAGEERWRLGSAAASAAVLAGWTYPLFAHWVWGGGWLAQLGVRVDSKRATATLQVVGRAGRRCPCPGYSVPAAREEYNHDLMPFAMPGHNAVFVLFGALLALLGWFGLNSAGAMLFYGAAPGRVPLIAINTTLCAGSGLLATALVTRTRFGKPDAWLSANGWTEEGWQLRVHARLLSPLRPKRSSSA